MLEDNDMSVQEAAAIMQDARARARSELLINPIVYVAWGLVLLLGYGAMWLSVRGQHPYRGPSGVSVVAVFVLAAFAIGAGLVIANRAIAGVGGRSARNRNILFATWGTGYLILLSVQAAIAGTVGATTLAFVGFAGPVLLIGLTYVLSAALVRNGVALAVGCWLLLVGASCGWQAPAGMLATCALAGGGGFLLMALIETRIRAHAG